MLSDFLRWNQALFFIEALLVLALFQLHFRTTAIETFLTRFSRHRFAPVAVGVFALALRAAVLPVEPVPSPAVHDEFSYLLAADTFAHGRLTNVTHPLWEHFETFHEDQRPTYMSMYPPLQGLVLAAGQVLTGSAFAGVWLSTGVLCAILCWALQGWFPPRWALLAASIAAMRLATFSYWDNSYWGGTVAAIGGALVFGALPRLLRSSRVRDALLAALGAAILANTRPYEGLVFCLGIAAVAVWQIRRLRLRAILPPACALLVCAGALMAYYDWRLYGNPATMPYMVNRQTYGGAPYFVFLPPRPPVIYRHAAMQEFYQVWERGAYDAARTAKGFLLNSGEKLYWWWSFFVGPVLTIPLLAFFWTWKSQRSRILLFLLAVVASASVIVNFFQPHYVAPATVLFYAAILQGMRAMNRKLPQAVKVIPIVCIAMIAVRAGLALTSLPPDLSSPKTWARSSHIPLGRETVRSRVLEDSDQNLVIVHYGPAHDIHAEYVFNDADIDASPIVWARDMGPERNDELLRYYASRKVWWLNVDADARLFAYPPP
jgi:hypothetical protein